MDFYIKQFIKRERMYKYFFSVETQLHYLKHLYFLMINGYSFKDALSNMHWDHKFIYPSEKITESLVNGKSIHEAFSAANFHESIIAYLQFSSHHEHLTDSFKNCVDMFEHRVNYIEKFKKTLRYPLFLGVILFILLIGLKQYVLPMFLQLFQGQSASSKTVVFSISFIEFLTTLTIILFLLGGLFSFTWKKYKDKLSIEMRLRLYEQIPIFRSFLILHTSYYLVTYVSMYLKASLPMKEILHQLANNHKLPVLAYYANHLEYNLVEGNAMSEAMKQLYFIDPYIGHIFAKGMNEDSLEKDLSIYAVYLGERMRSNMGKLIQWIQPVAFVSIALFIIFVYVTLMLPMYQLIQTI